MKKKAVLLGIILALFLSAGFFYFLRYGTGKAELSWNPNTEENLQGYKIYYGQSPRTDKCPPGGYPEHIDVGTSTAHVFEGLKNKATYYFSVTSYNTAGQESCFSDEVKKNIKISIKELLGIN